MDSIIFGLLFFVTPIGLLFCAILPMACVHTLRYVKQGNKEKGVEALSTVIKCFFFIGIMAIAWHAYLT